MMEPIARRRPEEVASDVSRAASADARAKRVRRQASRGSGPADRGRVDQRDLDRRARGPAGAARVRRGRRRKGGVYGVTRGLQRRFGITRVFDTLLDEQTILGVALGCGVSGLLPVPEIQYLAYLHNAEDQLRGEAATLPFFSNGQYRNPMVLRIAGSATRRASAGISTTTMPSQSSGTYPGSSLRLRHDRTTRRPSFAPAWRPRPLTARRAFSWSRSRSTTPVICSARTMAAGPRRIPRPANGRPLMPRSARREYTVTAPT